MFDSYLSRRSFLKTSLVSAALLVEMDHVWAMAPEPEALPEGKLSLHNFYLRERLTVDYRDRDGNYNLDALNSLNWILRCRFTGEVATMDIEAIEHLNLVDKKLGGGNEFLVISGYRSPRFNDLLLSEGRQVAKNSLHREAKAIDFSIPGVPLDEVHSAALELKFGGVGYYPESGFVHLDSGRFRTW